MRAFWTDEEVKILKEMIDAGMTLPEIKNVLKSRSLASLRNKASDLGLHVSAYDQPEIDMKAFKELMKQRRNVKCL